jgi:hypothetical protein
MSIWVTPTLLAGRQQPPKGLLVERCRTAQDATTVILCGARAWLDLDAWDAVARQVLIAVGATPAWAARQIHAARTGELLDESAFDAR